MLTLFAIPKPFIGADQEIILFGEDEGTAQVADEFGLRHVAHVARNQYGTPLVNDLFEKAQALASYTLLCYVNADILLMRDFVQAVALVSTLKGCFLMVGQRWDLDLKEPLNLNDAHLQVWLRARLAEAGRLHGKTGTDYFVFPSGLYRDIPPFALGRTVWDNWLLSRAKALGVPVINATEVVTVIHQNHDYAPNPEGSGEIWQGPEGDINMKLAGGLDYVLDLHHANWLLTPEGLRRPKLTKERLQRQLDSLRVRHPYLAPAAKLARQLLEPSTVMGYIAGRLRRIRGAA